MIALFWVVFPHCSSAFTLKSQMAFRMMHVLVPLSFSKIHGDNVYWRFLILPKMHFPDQFYIHFL